MIGPFRPSDITEMFFYRNEQLSDVEMMDLKTHLGIKERDERTEDASARLRSSRCFKGAHASARRFSIVGFCFFLQRLLATICQKNRWKNGRRNLGGGKLLQIAIFRNTIF